MNSDHTKPYRDPELAKNLIEKIRISGKEPVRLMEVCGTHTMSIFRSGIRDVLPDTISLLSGPGCPVCVTAQGEIDAFIELAKMDDVIVTTFGDLIRVPGSFSSLQIETSKGRDVRMVYSTFDALDIAVKNPDKQVVFLGVGFETTAPTIAAAILKAHEEGISNFSVQCAHKIVPPALNALVKQNNHGIDGFILPGHVSVIIGKKAYRPFFEKYHIPCCIAGFEPVDILLAIRILIDQIENRTPELVNGYQRAVTSEGNQKACKMISECFDIVDARWRGIGVIEKSGLSIKRKYRDFDARFRFNLDVPEAEEPKGCLCGEVLIGNKKPTQCKLYKTVCTPMKPVGPCMVSSEGTCAAFYRYHGD